MSIARVALLLTGAAAACSKATPANVTPPPVEVTVADLSAKDVELTYTYAGRVAAVQETEVRARVSGVLVDRAYKEGDSVKAGELLFRIDAATYDSARSRASAQLQQEHATLLQAENDERVAKELFATRAISDKQHNDALAAAARARAGVSAAEASLRSSSLELGYTTVQAPISGVTSVEALPKGSLVQVGTLLTRIRQVNPVYVEFSFDTDELAEIRRYAGTNDLREAHLPARVTFSDGTRYETAGVLDFVEAGVDRKTGTIRARATFQNAKGDLIPGEFVRVTIGGAHVQNAIVIPEKSLLQTVQGQFVYVVAADNKAEIRLVSLGREVEGGWLAKSGVNAGERIITEGIIKIRPGDGVKPMTAVAAAPATPAPAADGAANPTANAPTEQPHNAPVEQPHDARPEQPHDARAEIARPNERAQ